MLDHYKAELGKVSFDPILFRKELRKAFRSLAGEERMELRDWLKDSSYI